MKPPRIMVIAGEASGDTLAAELVQVLRQRLVRAAPRSSWDAQPLRSSLDPRFFGAGGPRMAQAGVDVQVDMTRHSVIGVSDVLKKLWEFRRIFQQLKRLAFEQTPELIVCVDFSGFNRRFAQAIRKDVRRRGRWFNSWNPKIVQFVSPQVWASREGRARLMARDYDLLLSIFPFEKEWYERKAPGFRVEFVGHPIVDRYAGIRPERTRPDGGSDLELLLLPGSRRAELKRHLPVMLEALGPIRARFPHLSVRMVLPDEALIQQAQSAGVPKDVNVQRGGLPEALLRATVAMASTGTVTMECAYFGVPTVAFYRTSWSTYQIGRRIVKVKFLAMPNILADEPVFPEFVQDQATGANLAGSAIELLSSAQTRNDIRGKLKRVVASLGPPGAIQRAADAILKLPGLDLR